jgi:hypothetical protein
VFVTVRCNPHHEIGFLKDRRRLNVALTRAKTGIVVVGNEDPESAELWKRLLDRMERVLLECLVTKHNSTGCYLDRVSVTSLVTYQLNQAHRSNQIGTIIGGNRRRVVTPISLLCPNEREVETSVTPISLLCPNEREVETTAHLPMQPQHASHRG